MIFKKFIDGEISATDAKLMYIRNKIEKHNLKRDRLNYICNALDIYEKRIINDDIQELLLEIAPMIENNAIIKEALSDDNDITNITMSLAKRFKNTQDLSVLAGLVILSIAARLPLDKANKLIAQAKQVAFSGKK